MEIKLVPFRLSAERRAIRLHQFNARSEIVWFGFEGSYEEPGIATITFKTFNEGLLGGGGTRAINGGVISAGFDAAFVLAGLGQYDVDVVVTLDLSVQFLSLARVSESLVFQAEIVRSAKNVCFARGILFDRSEIDGPHFALASAMLAPSK